MQSPNVTALPAAVCECGHRHDQHQDGICCVLDRTENLKTVFDDGRNYTHQPIRYCGCISFQAAAGPTLGESRVHAEAA